MSFEHVASGYSPAASCGALLEQIVERYDPKQGRGVNVAAARSVAQRAIASGVLTLPKYTHSPDEIIRRINHAKDMEQKRLKRLANPPPVKPHGNTGKKRPDIKKRATVVFTDEGKALNSARIWASRRNRKD